MKGNTRYHQRTFTVPGYGKVTIRSRISTSVGNFAGWNIDINGTRYYCNKIERQAAEDYAYVRWVNEVATPLPVSA